MEYYRDNDIAVFVRTMRKKAHLTQKEFAYMSGLGIRFIRELEQGKITLKMDKILVALNMFKSTLTVREETEDEKRNSIFQ